MFGQHINVNAMKEMMVNQEVSKICENHFACEGCPLKDKELNVAGSSVKCETKNVN